VCCETATFEEAIIAGVLDKTASANVPVEHDNYLLAALRYIHQNPVKAGIC